MQHAAGMRRLHRIGHLGQEGSCLPRGQRPLREPFGKGRALDESHAVKGQAVMLANLEDRHDARVVKLRRGLRLAAKAGQVCRTRKIPPQEHLDGDSAAQAPLQGAIHHPHPAAADLLQQFVVAKDHWQRRGTGHKTARLRPWRRCHAPRPRPQIILPSDPRRGLAAQQDGGLVGHRIGHRYHGKEFAELAGEIGVAADHRLQQPLRLVRVAIGELLNQLREYLFAVRREEGVDGTGAGRHGSGEWGRHRRKRSTRKMIGLPPQRGGSGLGLQSIQE